MSTNPIIPYTFVPGTKAKAQEINANFSSIADSIQSNSDFVNQKVAEINSDIAAQIGDVEESLETKADKNLSNVTTLASSSAKGLTWFGTGTGNVSSTRPAVVVATYLSGTTWYRLYSDKWIEQGGIITFSNSNDAAYTLTFPKAFKNTSYYFDYAANTGATGRYAFYAKAELGASTSVSAASINIWRRGAFNNLRWYAAGYVN